MKTITMNLSVSSINNAIKELNDYKRALNRRAKLFAEVVARSVVGVTQIRFNSAFYETGDNTVVVDVAPSGKGFILYASGKAVAFIEYGAGVTFNSPGSYPDLRPPGIVEIGEYGYGQGANYDGWISPYGHTFGNPAAMPMYFAKREMVQNLNKIAQEVFGSDRY